MRDYRRLLSLHLITPTDWDIAKSNDPERVAEWDRRLRLAWVDPSDCYLIRYWRGWWLVYRYRRNADGRFYTTRKRKRVAQQRPLLLRLGAP